MHGVGSKNSLVTSLYFIDKNTTQHGEHNTVNKQQTRYNITIIQLYYINKIILTFTVAVLVNATGIATTLKMVKMSQGVKMDRKSITYTLKFYTIEDYGMFGEELRNDIFKVTLYGYDENVDKKYLLEHAYEIADESGLYDVVVSADYEIYKTIETKIY